MVASGELVDAQTVMGLLLAGRYVPGVPGDVTPAVVDVAEDGPVLSRHSEEYLTWLAIEQGRARNTITSYRRDLVNYEAFLAARGQTVDDADVASVEEHLAQRRAGGLGPASVSRALAALRGLHRFLLEEGGAAADPTADVRPVRSPRRLPKAIDEDEVGRLLDTTTGKDPVSVRDRAILEVLYGTGHARVGAGRAQPVGPRVGHRPRARARQGGQGAARAPGPLRRAGRSTTGSAPGATRARAPALGAGAGTPRPCS